MWLCEYVSILSFVRLARSVDGYQFPGRISRQHYSIVLFNRNVPLQHTSGNRFQNIYSNLALGGSALAFWVGTCHLYQLLNSFHLPSITYNLLPIKHLLPITYYLSNNH